MNDMTPKIDEKAQIVLQAISGGSVILRFKKVADAERAYRKICNGWKNKDQIQVLSDMFESTIITEHLAFISFVEHAKYAKFKPYA